MARMRALEGKQLLEDDPTVVHLTAVAEPPELFQLKCPSRTLKGSNTLKQE
jgi:hypothetical protein